MVVEAQVDFRAVGEVGGDVAGGHLHLAVLHVLRVHEHDVADQVQVLEQHRAGEAVEVAAGDEPEAGWDLGHGGALRAKRCLEAIGTAGRNLSLQR